MRPIAAAVFVLNILGTVVVDGSQTLLNFHPDSHQHF